MKIEDPLFRKVNIYLYQFRSPVVSWMTDSEIVFLENHDLKMIEFLRFKSGNKVAFEMDVNSFQGLEYSDEIRHKRSPVLLKSGTELIESESLEKPLIENAVTGLKEKEKCIVYFSIENNLYHSEVTYVPEFEEIKRSSLSMFNQLFDEYLLEKFNVSSVQVIMAKYYL